MDVVVTTLLHRDNTIIINVTTKKKTAATAVAASMAAGAGGALDDKVGAMRLVSCSIGYKKRPACVVDGIYKCGRICAEDI